MNKNGYTLAEVLIILVVIGIIASLVILPIINNIQNAELKAAFKKNYSMIADATRRLAASNGGSLVRVFEDPDDEGPLTVHDDFRDKYLHYLSYVKKCDDSSTGWNTDGNGAKYLESSCWSKYNYYLNVSKGTDNWATDSQVVLTNGAILNFWFWGFTNCDHDDSSAGNGSFRTCGEILLDINGLKEPNRYGKDIFFVWVTKTGILPVGIKIDKNYGKCDPNDTGINGNGYGCTVKILNNDDY